MLFVASQVGVSVAYDALLIALVIPSTLAAIVTSGLTAAMVPAYVAIWRERGRPDASRLAATVLTWVIILTLAAMGLLVILADPLVSLIGPGLSSDAHAEAVGYLAILAPLVVVIGVSGILAAVCQAEERFKVIASATFLGPALGLLTLLAMWDRAGLQALAVANIVGPVVTATLLLVGLIRAAVHLRPHLVAPGLGIGELVRHAIPLTLSTSILQVTTIADRAIATLIAPGAVSALRYAEVLVRLPIGAIGPAWGNAVYPALVRAAHATGLDGLGEVTTRLVRLTTIVFLPIAGLTVAVAPVAVAVAYGRGAFTPEDLQMGAVIVAAYAPLILLLMLNPIVVDALNARRRGRVLLAGGIANATLTVILDVVLGLAFGVAGIALATSVMVLMVLVLVLGRSLARSEPEFRWRTLAGPTTRSILASIPGCLLIGVLAWSGLAPREGIPAIAFLGIAGIAGLASYAFVAIRMGLDEPAILFGMVRDRLGGTARRIPPSALTRGEK